MNHPHHATLLVAIVLALAAPVASAADELRGAAILEHPCGKAAVQQMGLVHAGKMDEANNLTTKEMQEQWKAMPADDRKMMSGMMQAMSQSEEEYAATIKANGVLEVNGADATLTIKKTTKDKNGSNTETMTQKYKIQGNQCLITH